MVTTDYDALIKDKVRKEIEEFVAKWNKGARMINAFSAIVDDERIFDNDWCVHDGECKGVTFMLG